VRSVGKTLASVSIVIAATVASTLSFAGPAAAAGWYQLQAAPGAIPSNAGSILLERSGANMNGRFCMTRSNATNVGVGVRHDQTITVTGYTDSRCQGSRTGAGIFYNMPDDWADGSCVGYGVNQTYLQLRFCR
jgi:hypothetical protein